jgi:hypothetical protein
MGETVLSRGAWRRQQAILWAVCLLGCGGLSWWIITRDWPVWAELILVAMTTSVFGMGYPLTYKDYLREQQNQDDFEDLLTPGRSGVLAKCRSCGRHTDAGRPTCVRCNAPDPVPDAAKTLRHMRFFMWAGGASVAATAITIAYLLLRALVSAVR